MKNKTGVTKRALNILQKSNNIPIQNLAKHLYGANTRREEAKTMRIIARIRMQGIPVTYDKSCRAYIYEK